MQPLLHLVLLCCCSTHMPLHHPRMPSYWWRSFRSQLFRSLLMMIKNVLIALTVLPGNHGHCCVSEAKQLPLKGHRHHFSLLLESFERTRSPAHFQLTIFSPSDCRLHNGTYWLIDISYHLFRFVFLPGAVLLAVQLLGT